jgi:hypothetical protein
MNKSQFEANDDPLLFNEMPSIGDVSVSGGAFKGAAVARHQVLHGSSGNQ